jgi:hypothetical protein
MAKYRRQRDQRKREDAVPGTATSMDDKSKHHGQHADDRE